MKLQDLRDSEFSFTGIDLKNLQSIEYLQEYDMLQDCNVQMS